MRRSIINGGIVRVALFVSCMVDLFYPEIGEATVQILRRAGADVYFPARQTCCGQVAYNTGYHDETAALAKHFVEVFERSDAIVSPSGSCAATVRVEYPHLFADNAQWGPRARQVAERTYELSEFLVRILKVDDLGAEWHGRITYHDACHGNRKLGIYAEPRRLLKHVRGLEIVEMERSDWCCGFGGTFAVKMPEVSVAIADHKEQQALATGADTVVTGDAACMMHMAGYFRRAAPSLKVLHFAQILAGGARDG